jgi:protocatechuate 3,4-dioxygenase beta subunit
MMRMLVVILASLCLLILAPILSAEEPPRTLSAAGKVLASDGKPVAGATVYLREWIFLRPTRQPADKQVTDILATTTTDDQGVFAFRQVALQKPYIDELPRTAPCPWDVVAMAKGRGLAWERPSTPRGRLPLELTLAPASKIQGRIVDPDGKPVGGAEVRVQRIQSLDQPAQGTVTSADHINFEGSKLPLTTTSDADGRFALDGLPANMRVLLAVSDNRFIHQSVFVATTDKAQPPVVVGRGIALHGGITNRTEPVHTGAFSVTLKPGHRLRVRVIAAGMNKPLPGARLTQVLGPSTLPAVPAADADGRLSVSPLAPGKYMLRVLPPNESDYLGINFPVTIPAEKREIEETASLPLGVAITGQVVEGDTGKGLAGVVVAHQPQTAGARDNRTLAPTARTGPDGRFRIAVLPGKGRIQVASDVPGYVRTGSPTSPRKEIESQSVQTVDVKPGEPLSGVKLTLVRGLVVTVRVVDGDGRPVPGARTLGSTSDKEGRLTLAGLDLRKVRSLVITQPERQLATRVELPLPKGLEPVNIEVKLSAAGSVTGRVQGDDHQPIQRASVQLLQQAPGAGEQSKVFNLAPVAPIPTDKEGRFYTR